MVILLRCFIFLTLGIPTTAAQDVVEATGCFLLTKQQVSVAVRDRGILAELKVEPGMMVETGHQIGSLDAELSQLALEAARLEVKAAKRGRELSLDVEIANASVEEAEKSLEQAHAEASVAAKEADTNVAVRSSEAALKLAQEELNRAQAARERFASSISGIEIFRLGSAVEDKQFAVEGAKHSLDVAQLKAESRSAAIPQHERAIERLKLEHQSSVNQRELEELNILRLTKAVEIAEEQVRRRQITSPIPGLVVERLHEPGEWVEPGEAVVRIVRLDRLLVKGFFASTAVSQASVGQQVEVVIREGVAETITKNARIVFVSPDVDPVNLEVLVHAEIENDDLRLRAGLAATMTLALADRPADGS